MKRSLSRIPFNLPHMTGKEMEYIAQSHRNGKLAGDMVLSPSIVMAGWSNVQAPPKHC